MGKLLLFTLIVAIAVGGVLYIFKSSITEKIINPIAKEKTIFEKPLAKYSFSRLRTTTFPVQQIRFGKTLKEDKDFTSRVFYFNDAFSGKVKKVSGLINIPTKPGTYPVIIMFRGFVERDQYTPGVGTMRTAEEFAKNGFITLAPDFLGYAESDMPSLKSIEERFQTYTTGLSLFAAVPALNEALEKAQVNEEHADLTKIGVWGHSNGGQIALSVLAISGKSYPTVLWAPVSKPFPYNILYFTDEFDDEGKALRKVVADFEKDYDVYKYSVTKYLRWIKAPISLHQGAADEEVPKRWSDQFDALLTGKKIEHEYIVYPGENHNFNNGSWSQAVLRSVSFYNTQFAASTPAKP